ncbi:hypothetical protein U1Q18_003800 [Sarracenia purpurea var. burkii]
MTEQGLPQASGKQAGEPITNDNTYKDSHSVDSKLLQRGNTSYGKIAGQDFRSQQKISHGPRNENGGSRGKQLPFGGEPALSLYLQMETIPCKEPGRLMECLEVSGQIKKIKEPTIFAHDAERFLAGERENSEGQRSEEKEGNYELEELLETFPSELGLISECYQISEEERVSLVNHTRSMGSPSKKRKHNRQAYYPWGF